MSQTATVLAVEDEQAIRDMLVQALERHGHHVIAVANVPAAKQVLLETNIDVALVDWMLPGASGLKFVRFLRNDESVRHLPIIMLTARSEEDDIAAGLDAGADDYVTKPFSPKELNSRINALLRRSRDQAAASASNTTLSAGPLRLNTATHQTYCVNDTTKTSQPEPPSANQHGFELGHTEFKLLRFLMENPEHVYSRSQLLDHVWGTGTSIEERTVDVHILRLRKALKPSGSDKMLETVRGAGYRLSANRLPDHTK